MNFIKRLFCKHKWGVIDKSTTSEFSPDGSLKRLDVFYLLKCSICRKRLVKKARII